MCNTREATQETFITDIPETTFFNIYHTLAGLYRFQFCADEAQQALELSKEYRDAREIEGNGGELGEEFWKHFWNRVHRLEIGVNQHAYHRIIIGGFLYNKLHVMDFYDASKELGIVNPTREQVTAFYEQHATFGYGRSIVPLKFE